MSTALINPINEKDYLNPYIINPLNKLGLELLSLFAGEDKEKGVGATVLILRCSLPNNPHKEVLEVLEKAHDGDNAPISSTWDEVLGMLFITIPYIL